MTLTKAHIGVNNIVVTKSNTYKDTQGITQTDIHIRPYKSIQHICPKCGRKCPGYDRSKRKWRDLNSGATRINLVYSISRIVCPEHGVITEDVPWAFPGSRFTKHFEYEVAHLAEQMSKKAVSEYMAISWRSVGNCMSRVLEVLEPNRLCRLENLRYIGIDETSYRKGHKYITTVVNHETKSVVWVHPGHSYKTISIFFKLLTPEQRSSIQIVTSDSARWVAKAIEDYIPSARQCIDGFHVVSWATDAVDKIRRQVWQVAHKEAKELRKKVKISPGRHNHNDVDARKANIAINNAKSIKGTRFTLLKGAENHNSYQEAQLKLIAIRHPDLYEAYCLKEELRTILQIEDITYAVQELDNWFFRARDCNIEEMNTLADKIMRNRQGILNTISYNMSNARIEALNNKIKLLVRKAYGFRSMKNLLDMVYLVCSPLKIPLVNSLPR